MSSDSLQRKQKEHDRFLLVAQLVKVAMHPIPVIEKQKNMHPNYRKLTLHEIDVLEIKAT